MKSSLNFRLARPGIFAAVAIVLASFALPAIADRP